MKKLNFESDNNREFLYATLTLDNKPTNTEFCPKIINSILSNNKLFSCIDYRLHKNADTINIYVNLDYCELINIIKNGVINNRKTLFEILRHKHRQDYLSYCRDLILNVKHSPKIHIKTSPTLDQRCLEWMITTEQEKNRYYFFPKNSFPIGDYLIDTKNGVITDKLHPNTVSFSSGVLVDLSHVAWIEAINKLIIYSSGVENIEGLIPSSVTLLIVGSVSFNTLRTMKINGLYINSIKKLKQIDYFQLLQQQLIIITHSVLKNGYYKYLLDNFRINNDTSFDQTVKIAIEQLKIRGWDKITKDLHPIFGLIAWRRIIYDDETMSTIFQNNNFCNIVSSLKSSKKWGILHQVPSDHQTLESIKIISSSLEPIQFPLYKYDNNQYNICCSTNLIKINNCHNKTKIIRKIVSVDFHKESLIIYNELINDIYNYLSCNKQFYNAYRGIITILEKIIWGESCRKNSKDLLDCPICLQRSEEYLISKCHHKLCIKCCFKNLSNSKNCPLCRSETTYTDMCCPLSKPPDKLSEAYKLISPVGVTLIFSTVIPSRDIINEIFTDKDLTVIVPKKKIPLKYLKNNRLCIFLQPSDINLASSIININTVVFLDLGNGLDNEDHRLFGSSSPEVYYLVYKNSIESDLASVYCDK